MDNIREEFKETTLYDPLDIEYKPEKTLIYVLEGV